MGSMSFYTSEEVWEGQQRQEDHHGSRQAASLSSMHQGAEKTLSAESTGWPNHQDEIFGMAVIVERLFHGPQQVQEDALHCLLCKKRRRKCLQVHQQDETGWLNHHLREGGHRQEAYHGFRQVQEDTLRVGFCFTECYARWDGGIQRDKTDRIIWMSSPGRPATSRGWS